MMSTGTSATVGVAICPQAGNPCGNNFLPSNGDGYSLFLSLRYGNINFDDGELKVQVFGRGFAWLDTGTHDSLAEASTFVEVIEKRTGLKIACLEGIAYRHGWITEAKMRELAQPMMKNQYGQYLLKVIDELKE